MPLRQPLTQPLFEPSPSRDLESWVLDYARREDLFAPGDRVLVAVSGGPDSVALLHLLNRLRGELGLSLALGHFDHGLRGRDSEKDAAFVADLAERWGLPCHMGRGDVRSAARARKISFQMAGRQLRLDFLQKVCRAQGYGKLALGHTADDQVELFFLRLLRGAGPEGLKGMWPATPEGRVRPLLAVGKAVILAWLAQAGLPFRTDRSNLGRAYLRNRVRLDLLPELLQSYNPRLKEAVWRAQALLQADARLLARQTETAWAEVGRTLGPEVFSLDLPRFFELEAGLQTRLLRATVGRILQDGTLGAAHLENLLALARGTRSGAVISLGEARVARAGEELHLFRCLPAPPPGAAAVLPAPEGAVESPEGWRWELSTRAAPAASEPPPSHTARLDPERLAWPLTVRYFQPGDRFWPQGGPGRKKLQDFLVDAKIPRWLRPHLPLVLSAGQVVWVPGLRVAEPAAWTPASRTLLEIRLTPTQPETARIWQVLQALREGEGW